MSDALSSISRRHILEHSENNFSYPRGRPSSDSNPDNERRGRRSYYDRSRIKKIIDKVLNDKETFEKVDNAVTSSEIFFEHRKYSIEVALHQMKKHEKEFLNTYKPVFKKYSLKGKEASSSVHINKEDITDELIEKTATGLAHETKSTENEKRAIYTQGAIIFFNHIIQKH